MPALLFNDDFSPYDTDEGPCFTWLDAIVVPHAPKTAVRSLSSDRNNSFIFDLKGR
jgi:hypothetical protein